MADKDPKKDKSKSKATGKDAGKKSAKASSGAAKKGKKVETKGKPSSKAQSESKADPKLDSKSKPVMEPKPISEDLGENAGPNQRAVAADADEAPAPVPARRAAAGLSEDAVLAAKAREIEGVDPALILAAHKLKRHFKRLRGQVKIDRAAGEIGPDNFLTAGVGVRKKAEKFTDEPCVVVIVARKVQDKSKISAAADLTKILADLGLPADLPIDVLPGPQAGWTLAFDEFITIDLSAIGMATAQQVVFVGDVGGMLQPGYTVGTKEAMTGTFGALVKVNNSNTPHLISNNHVIANVSADIDGVVREFDGLTIRHPGPADEKTDAAGNKIPAVKVGKLVDKTLLQLSASPSAAPDNELDAAIAVAQNVQPRHAMQPNNVRPNPGLVTFPLQVQKVGRTTGLTFGKIVGQADSPVIQYRYGRGSSDVAYGRFADVYHISATDAAGADINAPFSQGGDSGSLVMTTDNPPRGVALLFAGSSNGITYAIPIQRVFDAFDIEKFWQ